MGLTANICCWLQDNTLFGYIYTLNHSTWSMNSSNRAIFFAFNSWHCRSCFLLMSFFVQAGSRIDPIYQILQNPVTIFNNLCHHMYITDQCNLTNPTHNETYDCYPIYLHCNCSDAKISTNHQPSWPNFHIQSHPKIHQTLCSLFNYL